MPFQGALIDLDRHEAWHLTASLCQFKMRFNYDCWNMIWCALTHVTLALSIRDEIRMLEWNQRITVPPSTKLKYWLLRQREHYSALCVLAGTDNSARGKRPRGSCHEKWMPLANVSNMNLNTARGCGANTELIDSLPVQTTTALMLLFQVYFSSYFLLTSEIKFIETLWGPLTCRKK